MHIVRTPGSARAIARTLKRPVGFVPTMGALHAGHLSLVRRARSENASVIASIFVNPTQFAPGEDFDKYPRAFERDVEALEQEGVDLVYAPAVERMYPRGFSASIDVGTLGKVLEGERRPGHFAGVATVVAKLLSALEPTSMYLGQKDVQQTAVLRAVVRDLDMATNVVVVPTVREPDGLALSSRNVRLGAADRPRAAVIKRALAAGADAVAGGEDRPRSVRAAMLRVLASEPGVQPEYVEAVDALSMAVPAQLSGEVRLLIAARVGGVRLIDNVGALVGVQVGNDRLAMSSKER